MPTAPVLSPADIEHFVEYGFIKVSQALDPAVIRRSVDRMWTRLGYDRADPTTWTVDKIHMPAQEDFVVQEVASRAYAASCQLCGGEARVDLPQWDDSFIVNFHYGDGKPWVPPSPAVDGWHKDGDWFIHFPDSPEQGLLSIVLWSDVHSRGGATFLAADSVGPVARYMAAHPEGIHPFGAIDTYAGFPTQQFIAECRDFREATGKAGDVYLMHPYMLHASSYNELRLPRVITNPNIDMKEPMRFDRPRLEDHSPVERAVLRALGKERYAFPIPASRPRIVPPRIAVQSKLKEQEDARLASENLEKKHPQP